MRHEQWEESFIQDAEWTFRKVFADWYERPVAGTLRATDSAAAVLTTTPALTGMRARFYGAGGMGNGQGQSEVDRYLAEPPTPRDVDVLAFWKGRQDLPLLQRMARHYLCVPATSTPSERVFSTGRDLIGVRRASLGPKMIRELTLLKLWKKAIPDVAVKSKRS